MCTFAMIENGSQNHWATICHGCNAPLSLTQDLLAARADHALMAGINFPSRLCHATTPVQAAVWMHEQLDSTLCLCLQLPPQFSDDLFAAMGPENRPDHRWLIFGPARSGSSFHQDPNATSAWNAVIYGAKKWILYPPHITPPGKPCLHPLAHQEQDLSAPIAMRPCFALSCQIAGPKVLQNNGYIITVSN